VNPLALHGAVKAWTIRDINRRDSQRPGEGVFEVTLKDHMGWRGGRWAKMSFSPVFGSRARPADTRPQLPWADATIPRPSIFLHDPSFYTRQPAFDHQLVSIYLYIPTAQPP
jgi:hypothetical protein